MHGIFTQIWLIFMVNVAKYTIITWILWVMRGGMSQIWVLGKLVQTIVLTNHVQELEANHLPTLHIPKRDAGSPGHVFFQTCFPWKNGESL